MPIVVDCVKCSADCPTGSVAPSPPSTAARIRPYVLASDKRRAMGVVRTWRGRRGSGTTRGRAYRSDVTMLHVRSSRWWPLQQAAVRCIMRVPPRGQSTTRSRRSGCAAGRLLLAARWVLPSPRWSSSVAAPAAVSALLGGTPCVLATPIGGTPCAVPAPASVLLGGTPCVLATPIGGTPCAAPAPIGSQSRDRSNRSRSRSSSRSKQRPAAATRR